MERDTLATAKASAIPSALGYCPDDPRFVRTLNKARQRLFNHGRWWGTIVRARFCVDGACVTWPGMVANVERMTVCGQPVTSHNAWYEYISTTCNIPTCTSCRGSGTAGRCAACGCLASQDHLSAPFHTDICGNRYVRLYPGHPEDVGKRVLLQGYDLNRIWVRTRDGQRMVDGEYVTLALPFATSTTVFSTVTGVQKDETLERVLAYQVHRWKLTETPFATWGPTDRNPTFRRSLLPFFRSGCTRDGCAGQGGGTIQAIVKLAYQPVASNEDWLVIDNLVALEHACRAELWFEQSRQSEAFGELKLALSELNHELRTMTGDKVEVKVDLEGCASFNRVFAGFR